MSCVLKAKTSISSYLYLYSFYTFINIYLLLRITWSRAWTKQTKNIKWSIRYVALKVVAATVAIVAAFTNTAVVAVVNIIFDIGVGNIDAVAVSVSAAVIIGVIILLLPLLLLFLFLFCFCCCCFCLCYDVVNFVIRGYADD